jgi:hypothetical protein
MHTSTDEDFVVLGGADNCDGTEAIHTPVHNEAIHTPVHTGATHTPIHTGPTDSGSVSGKPQTETALAVVQE